MEPLYSLEYFDRIFGVRGPEFWELVVALEEQLESYASDLPRVLLARSTADLAWLRHTHRPVVENLGLHRIRSLEAEIREAIETRAPDERLQDLGEQFSALARALAAQLTEERTRADD